MQLVEQCHIAVTSGSKLFEGHRHSSKQLQTSYSAMQLTWTSKSFFFSNIFGISLQNRHSLSSFTALTIQTPRLRNESLFAATLHWKYWSVAEIRPGRVRILQPLQLGKNGECCPLLVELTACVGLHLTWPLTYITHASCDSYLAAPAQCS